MGEDVTVGTMNEHIPDEIKKKWPQYEFIGKPIKKANGKTYIRAKHKVWFDGHIHIYCVEDNWFWHDIPMSEVP